MGVGGCGCGWVSSALTGQVCCRYLEAHLAVKVEQLKASLLSSDGGVLVPQQLLYKVTFSFHQ